MVMRRGTTASRHLRHGHLGIDRRVNRRDLAAHGGENHDGHDGNQGQHQGIFRQGLASLALGVFQAGGRSADQAMGFAR